MWDAIILTGRHSVPSFETFEDLRHTYSWMKYYNTELDVNKNDEDVLRDLLNEVTKSIEQSLSPLLAYLISNKLRQRCLTMRLFHFVHPIVVQQVSDFVAMIG